MNGTRSFAALVAFAIATPLRAARAQAPSPPLIWYRSGEGCPDGTGFLQRLEARGVHAKLAGVGDPIDFVVTLGVGSDGARGLLERQTKTGTVAIRRLDGGTCDDIADGLALSLSLADAPEERRRDEPAAPAAPIAESTRAPALLPPPDGDAASGASNGPGPEAPRARIGIRVVGEVVSGVAPYWLPGASLFIDVEPGDSFALPRSSLRVGAFVNGSSSAEREYDVWLLGGRAEACPTWIGVSAVRLHPCAAIDLGTIQTSGSGASARTSGAFWSAARFGARVQVPLGDSARLEAQSAAQFPLTRYEIVAGIPEKPLYRTAVVGVDIGVGAYFVLP